MVDSNLQARSGQNVGCEPMGSIFLAKASGTSLFCSANGTTLLQGADGRERTPRMPIQTGPQQAFFAVNTDVNPFVYDLIFIDAQNREHPITVGGSIPAAGFGAVSFGAVWGAAAWWALKPGEKIVVRPGDPGEATNANPANVRVYTYFADAKTKPTPKGANGGISDGNLVNLRFDVTATDSEYGPPPGKAWAEVVSPISESSALLVNYSTVDPASVGGTLVNTDGSQTTIPFNQAVAASTAVATNGASGMGVIAYPAKVRFRQVGATKPPVMALFSFVEFDLPSE